MNKKTIIGNSTSKPHEERTQKRRSSGEFHIRKRICGNGVILKTKAIWTQTKKKDSKPSGAAKRLPAAETDVAVIGGGLAGLLCAWHLKQKGIPVLVLEAGQLGRGESGNTTAKITIGHRFLYHRLIKEAGLKLAAQYGNANAQAVARYHKMVSELQIDCDYKILPMYVFTDENSGQVKRELKALHQIGLKGDFTSHIELPIPIKGAIRYPEQAQFHPIKFMEGLAERLSICFENPVTGISGHTVHTVLGDIKANYIVIASHYPILNFPGFYFARMYQERSYALAVKGAPELSAMYAHGSSQGYAYRSYGKYLIVSGNSHRTGKNLSGDYFSSLRAHINQIYPDAAESFHWSAQDCMTPDGIPFIGKYSLIKPYCYVAAGFNKWGMTSAMAAAAILADEIAGEPNACSQVFSPQRFRLKASRKRLASHMAHTWQGLVTDNGRKPQRTPEDIRRGQGAIVYYDGKRTGAFRDEEGKLHFVPAKCPHLGCALSFNPEEKTWDCPCHGTRLSIDGEILDGPARPKNPNG